MHLRFRWSSRLRLENCVSLRPLAPNTASRALPRDLRCPMNAKSQSRGSSLVTPSDALNSGAIIRVKGELHAHSYEVQVQVRERHLSQEEDREISALQSHRYRVTS
jgi:hypothetical protein